MTETGTSTTAKQEGNSSSVKERAMPKRTKTDQKDIYYQEINTQQMSGVAESLRKWLTAQYEEVTGKRRSEDVTL